jgi:uncharacterized protein YjbI with pentapeptide repeats
MLKFIKDLFGGKDDGALKYHKPPAGTELRETNIGAFFQNANKAGATAIGGMAGVELGPKAIAKLSLITNLQGLDLSDAKVDDTCLSELNGQTKLVELNLSNTPISGACFVKIGRLPNLEVLNLSGTNVVDMTLVALAKSARKLRDLNLAGTKITDTSLDYIMELKGLKVLRIADVKLDAAKLQLLTHDSHLKVVDL